MASDIASAPVNGVYDGQNYGPTEQNLAAHNAHNATFAPNASIPNGTNVPSAQPESLTKEEVGWYFVERYYTTLSKSPEKLYLYYNKRSQSVFGVEEEKAPVCVGQRSIQERMAELDFQDCKVRVSNVDSQESGEAIVIQVIGEISNKSQPHRKFVQTFVLATQTNGYYVLNDVFRYIAEEELVEATEQSGVSGLAESAAAAHFQPASTAESSYSRGLSNAVDAAESEREAHVVDEKLETLISGNDTTAASFSKVNGTSATSADPVEIDDAAALKVNESTSADVDAGTELQAEQPKDPKPSPVPTPAQAQTKPAAPSTRAAPKTWASMIASTATTTTPARTAPPTTTLPVATPQQKQNAPSPVPAQAATSPSAPSAAATAVTEKSESDPPQNDGWQAVGTEHSRKQSRAHAQVGSETPRYRAYIKNVFASVEDDALRAKLKEFGELVYFDISRAKNCAFVDFATQDGFEKAVRGSPHAIGSDSIVVEERRERPFPYQPRGGMRGGRGGADNRPGQGRGFPGKDNARGGMQQRGRGGNTTPRGRGTPQA